MKENSIVKKILTWMRNNFLLVGLLLGFVIMAIIFLFQMSYIKKKDEAPLPTAKVGNMLSTLKQANEAIQVAQKISTTASIVMDKDASIVDKGKAVVETLQEAEKAVRPVVENTKKHIEVHKRTKEATKTLEKSTKKIREERKEALKKIEERRASQSKVEEKPLEKEEVDVLQEFATNFDEGLEP